MNLKSNLLLIFACQKKFHFPRLFVLPLFSEYSEQQNTVEISDFLASRLFNQVYGPVFSQLFLKIETFLKKLPLLFLSILKNFMTSNMVCKKIPQSKAFSLVSLLSSKKNLKLRV